MYFFFWSKGHFKICISLILNWNMHRGTAPEYFLLTTLHSILLNPPMAVSTLLQRSLQHWVSGHTKQYGWLCLSALVQRWSSRPVVPLYFNDNWSTLCFFLLQFSFWYKSINISSTSSRDGWTGLGTAKVGCFPLFLPFQLFSHRVM